MNGDLTTLNDILYLHLRPWMANHTPQKYLQLLTELPKASYQFQPLYDLAFIRPVNEKRKFYHALISNEAITFLNYIHNQIETALTENEKKYWARSALDKKLKPKFTELKTIIEEKQYQLKNINPANDEAYIFQLLKYQVIRLYLEIQDSYTHYLEEDPLTEEDIHLNFFTDSASGKHIIVEAEKQNLPQRKLSPAPKPQPESFEQRNYEIRDPQKGILAYEEIVATPERLGRVEIVLYEEKLIDRNFVLIMAQGNIKKMAAVGQVLFKNNYFKKVHFPHQRKKNITDVEVKDFLSHRYRANIDQEFRRFRKADKLTEYLENNRWIAHLPSY